MMSAGMRMAPCVDQPGDWPAGVITSYLRVNHALRGERNKAYKPDTCNSYSIRLYHRDTFRSFVPSRYFSVFCAIEILFSLLCHRDTFQSFVPTRYFSVFCAIEILFSLLCHRDTCAIQIYTCHQDAAITRRRTRVRVAIRKQYW